MVSKERYKEFAQFVDIYTKAIDTKQSTETKGKIKKIVFSRMMLAESMLWFSFIQLLFIVLGLMDDVINNINSGLRELYLMFGNHNPLQFPVNIASFIALGLLVFFFCFGFVAYKYLKTPQITNQISVRNSGGFFMMYDMFRQIKDENKKIMEELKELRNNEQRRK